jgi:endonuclease-3
MARKTARKKSSGKKPLRKASAGSVRGRIDKARHGKAARVKPPKAQVAADRKAVSGTTQPWTPAEIEEAFRRFQAANAEPKGELFHNDPYTLLVAVVLSAQATDAGVNKATPALFAAAPTPEKMVALGEDRVRDLIKTIGLFRT